ncbi:MAG: hypothetical protein J5552_09505 [Prevotella sp.]|nr:hypothetical protein [Prevotella sp.]
MKKILLLLGGVFFALSSFAQEDVTYLIKNAGFEEDLTWQADGAKKEIVDQSTVLSNRSLAGVAADGSLYALVNPSTPNKRSDGRTLEATNGFIGAISGWVTDMPTDKKCEWVYFGTVPYDLGETAIPVADDGSTYLSVPAKPDAFNTDDNKGLLYLRAGWGGGRSYRQVVKLPCAVYRLEYWTININPNSTATAEDLTKITCRKDVFKDEAGTGLSSHEWVKHEFEFTPTTEFTMEFGFKSANTGSGNNPIVCLDGIKLWQIGEADPAKLYESDILDLITECIEMNTQAVSAGYVGLSSQLSDYMMTLEDYIGGSVEELAAALNEANESIVVYRNAIKEMENVDAMLAKMEEYLRTTDYTGKAALMEAYEKILGYKENEPQEGEDVAALILGAYAEGEAAIRAYIMSQTGSEENPADFTIFISHPWFIESSAEPSFIDSEWAFPKRYDEEGNDLYVEGSASSPDLTSAGWYIAGAEGGDQRLNWQRQRSCWNAWNNNFTTTLAVAQDIEGLPNGYYTISADLVTQSSCLTNQHVFGQSIAEKKISGSLTQEGWDYNEWETLAMDASQKVLVVDGKLTIGAEGTGNGSGAAGWFCATNFHLYYLGEAPAEAVEGAYVKKLNAAQEFAAGMHFALDKQALNDAIALYSNATDYVPAMTGLQEAMNEAQKSENKYEEYIPSDGTIEGKTIPTVYYTLKKNGGEGYGAAEDIVSFAYNYVQKWIACDTATYTKFDATVDLLKNYLNVYTPVYNEAASVAASASAAGKAALNDLMAQQKATLTTEMRDLETVNELLAKLNEMMRVVKKQNLFDDENATDYTAFIQNPKLEAETGWDFNKGNGNNNTNGGQWYDGSSTRYIDSYNSNGLVGFIATQLITELPNGTYNVGVYTRTPAEGAYILNAVSNDTVFVEIPMNYYKTYTDLGEDTVIVASDNHGPMWEEAEAAWNAGTYTDEQFAIFNANDGNGRGWQHQEMNGIEVKNHELLIGTMAGTEASKTPKVFGGAWYSVGGWTLTLVAKGDNSGWEGPLAAGIRTVDINRAPDGIYSISGIRQSKLQPGLNIIVSDGKAKKIMMK